MLKMRIVVSVALLLGFLIASGCGDDDGGGPVGPTNRPPVIQALPDTSATVGDTLKLWAIADDPDGDELTYRLTIFLTSVEIKLGYRPDADLDEQTAYFWFKPGASDLPSRSFRIR